MNSSIDSISARWADYSRITKEELLNLSAPEKSLPVRPSLEVIQEIILLAEHKITDSFLIITRTISEAESLATIIRAMSGKIKVKAVLPHHAPLTVSSKESGISILPFSIFSLLEYRTFPWESFETIIIEQNLMRQTISALLEINNVKNIILNSQTQSLIFARFQNLVSVEEHQTPRSIRPLEKFAHKRAAKEILAQHEEAAASRKKISLKSDKDSSAQKTKAADSKTPSQEESTSNTPEEKHFIAMMPRNYHRQYIRDYIRRFDLKNCLIVAHNRQAARQLENYLYRARIRTKVVHEKLADNAKSALVERFNRQNINVLIVMHRVVEEITPGLDKIDSVFFLDLPSAYVEYAERLTYVKEHFSPEHFISIATENERVWVQSLKDEYIQFSLPIIEIDPEHESGGASKNARNSSETEGGRESSKTNRRRSRSRQERPNNRRTQNRTHSKNRKHSASDRRDGEQKSTEDQQSRDSNNKKQNRSGRKQGRRTQNNETRNHTPRKEQNSRPESQADFFESEQTDVVNRNRMPFELGSFEANIAQQNRRRMREVFSNQNRQTSGHGNQGNFVQNITANNTPGNSPNRRRNQSKRRNNNRGGNNS